MTRVQAYGITDVGVRRSHNEDNFLIHPGMSLFVVADGMGGHVGGELASALAVTTIEEVLTRLEGCAAESVEDPHHLQLEQAVKIAGRRIHQMGNEDPEFQGMGTTAVAAWVVEERVYVANVGDSRVYLLRGEDFQQITEDHSLIAERVRHGLITEDEAKNHRMRNVITRSLGYQEEVDVDIDVMDACDGDIFLLCSDGLTEHVEDHEMAEHLGGRTLQDALKRLVALACDRGGEDNITMVGVRIERSD